MFQHLWVKDRANPLRGVGSYGPESERFTLLNRVPFGKFNGVNSEPMNAYIFSKFLCVFLTINFI